MRKLTTTKKFQSLLVFPINCNITMLIRTNKYQQILARLPPTPNDSSLFKNFIQSRVIQIRKQKILNL